MQNNNRTSIFAPFDALNGFKEAIKKVEKIVEEKKILSEDIFEELNYKLKNLKKDDYVNIEYYDNIEYIKTMGIIKKIDLVNKKIYILNSIIDMDEIINIEKL